MNEFTFTWILAGGSSLVVSLLFMDSLMNYLESGHGKWAIKLPTKQARIQLLLLLIASFGGAYVGINIALGFAQASANLSCIAGECIDKAVFAAMAPKSEPLFLGFFIGIIPTCMARGYYLNAYHSYLRNKSY
jgi:hypothetical protein